MLLLKVAKNERVRLRVNGVEIWVAVLTAGDGSRRLGFDAPPCVEIAREELLKDEGNKAA